MAGPRVPHARPLSASRRVGRGWDNASVRRVPVAALLVLVACGAGTRVSQSGSAAQALRTCVDRWNEGNMRSWGPAAASVGASPPRPDAPAIPRPSLRPPALRRHRRIRPHRDLELRDRPLRRVHLPNPARARSHPPHEQERNDGQPRCPEARRPAGWNARAATARVAALPADRRLRRAVDTRRHAASRPQVHLDVPGRRHLLLRVGEITGLAKSLRGPGKGP